MPMLYVWPPMPELNFQSTKIFFLNESVNGHENLGGIVINQFLEEVTIIPSVTSQLSQSLMVTILQT